MSTEPGNWSRRQFLASAAMAGAGVLASGCRKPRARFFPGEILGASHTYGHLLRGAELPVPGEYEEMDVAIVGAGIAGLSAARALRKRGMDRVVVLDLEKGPGGNAISGENEISAYPWGAHYVPLPGESAEEIRQLFVDLGLITGEQDGLPVYEETALCADPPERLFAFGRWHEGLLPTFGMTATERAEVERFQGAMEAFKRAIGSDGKPAFVIPIDRSSRDPAFLALDKITMQEWLDRERYRGAMLRWYVDYCCRDDYGAHAKEISAWAGIHYFAARTGQAANAATDAVLTWPEGNGWLARRLSEGAHIRTGCLTYRVRQTAPETVEVHFLDTASGQVRGIRARAAILAIPHFIASRLVEGLEPAKIGELPLPYSPWLVANISMRGKPVGRGFPLAWDNVFRESGSLGYVVATHQKARQGPSDTVLTYYYALCDLPPDQARNQALARTHADWCGLIVDDLEKVHPGISNTISRVDVWLWGHAMIRPVPGLLWGGVRETMREPRGAIFFAHSDQSGISIFEEAYIRGLEASEALLQHLAART